jgi:hypothetical protein
MKAKEPKPSRAMKQSEKPVPFMARLYKKQRRGITRLARTSKVSSAYVVRLAVDKLLAEHGMI